MLIRSAPSAGVDAREHARPVGHMDAEAEEVAGILVGGGEHAAAVRRRLPDPAREEARVVGPERGLELLHAAAVLGERAATAPRLSRKMSTQIAGWHRPRGSCREGAAGRRAARDPRRAPRRVVQQEVGERVGRWLVIATRRSWASGSTATGCAPSAVTKPCSSA